MQEGYYRYPTIFGDTVVFVSEGDLWSVNLNNPIARRLSFNRGEIKYPVFSPDGHNLAFSSSDEGASEVFIMPASGGEMKRITFLGDNVNVIGWTNEGIYYSTSAGEPFLRVRSVFRVQPDTGAIEKMPIGLANFISYAHMDEKGAAVIQRHGYREYSYWKRYRGGTAGNIWIDATGAGNYKKLVDLKGDLARPIILKDKVFFSSDHEGTANLYSCNMDGSKLSKLTDHKDYYVRNQASDGKRIVYHAGADLFVYDPQLNESQKIDVIYHSDRPGRSRKFFNTSQYLQYYNLHPKGHHLSLVSRGKPCFFSNWEGPVIQFGEREGVRYNFVSWLADGLRLVVVSDIGGQESLEIYDAQSAALVSKPKTPLDIGRVANLWVNPKSDHVVVTNHAHELLLIDLKKWKVQRIDRSEYGAPGGCAWSPDGQWLAYSTTIERRKRAIKLYNLKDKKITQITAPVLRDECPTFDPEGKYLYFLSWRHFDPSWDQMHFELGFHFAVKPYLITLQKDLTSPFLKTPEVLDFKKAKDEEQTDKEKAPKEKPIQIDLDGIQNRVIEFPVDAGDYSQLQAAKGRVYFISHPLEPAPHYWNEARDESHNALDYYDFDSLRYEHVMPGVDAFHLSTDHRHMVYRIAKKLRVVKIGEKPEEDKGSSKKSGWINLGRIKLSVNRTQEWEQIYKEAWRLQRDHYWIEDMSKIDWLKVYNRYFPLLSRVSTREEFSDLLWEMQGELGTSHAYVFGGDIKQEPSWYVGSLGADLVYDSKQKAYKITNIMQGDRWSPNASSPLLSPGINVKEGDYLFAINKSQLTESVPPASLLVNLAEQEVELEIADHKLKNKRTVIVKTISHQYDGRYRDWVEKNRQYVHKKSGGKIGYIHIPDMSAHGFAEFHRSFLSDLDRDGLIVDVRFNGGGNVSQLLLEKLARRRLGYDVARWQHLNSYPEEAPLGPMVAIENEYTGSDGDIFSHSFKMMKLGTLIGKRSWGGVIGIFPRYDLMDGGFTTQPEYSFWFKDVGWAVENYGVDPDIEVEITPQDYAHDRDPQMDRAIEELSKILLATQEERPTLETRPSLKLPG
jgi:tricorn protease